MDYTGDAKQQIEDLIATIEGLNEGAMSDARIRQQSLTKPAGSLGRLEALAIQLAGIKGRVIPEVTQKAVIVMAGDHGVTVAGVSAYPSAVTAQMVYNFLNGGAAINVLARQADARVIIVDIGVAEEIDHAALISRKVAFGTANMATGAAMTRQQATRAIQVGIDILNAQAAQGLDLVATGDMGIGNTTASSAISAALLGKAAAQVTGRGTGLGDEQLAHKVQVIEQALALNMPDSSDPLDVLAKVGGLEIAGLVGVILAAAAQHIPIVIDGFISGAAALVAARLCPAVQHYLIASHVSVEPGHQYILQELGLTALLNLDLRLGEGTGAVLAMHLIEAATQTHREMATFAEAGVSTREEEA